MAYLNLKFRLQNLLAPLQMSRLRIIILIIAFILSFYFNVLAKLFCHKEHLEPLAVFNKLYSGKGYDPLYTRSTFSDPIKIMSNSWSLNKYAFWTASDSYATYDYAYNDGKRAKVGRYIVGIEGHTVKGQLKIGVRALMLKVYNDVRNDIWVGMSVNPDYGDDWFNEYTPLIAILKEVEEFLSSNPLEIFTLILEDCVMISNILIKIFEEAKLTKYMLPLSKMPQNGGAWPLVKDMVADNQRLVVFTSNESNEEREGIAYKWNFMVECNYGSQQRIRRSRPPCSKGEYLSTTNNINKSLVLLNYHSSPEFNIDLMKAIHKCYAMTSNRWPNFIIADNDRGLGEKYTMYYFLDFLNGKLLCGCDDINLCKDGLLRSLRMGSNMLCWGRELISIRFLHPLNITFISIVVYFYYTRR